eukprot:jgi/Tetstr1/428468/TSEL_018479.t1
MAKIQAVANVQDYNRPDNKAKGRPKCNRRQEGGRPSEGNANRQFGRNARGADRDDTEHDNACVTASAGVEGGRFIDRLEEQDNNKHKEQRDIPSDDDGVGEGGKEPDLWRPRNDEADRYLTKANKTASRDEYRHMLCYGVYRAAANAAAKTALATLRAPDTPTQDRVDALDLRDAAHRTLEAMGDADEAKLTYLRRFKAKKALTPKEQFADTKYSSVEYITKAQASATFKRQAAERDTDRDKARKEKVKAARESREQQRREADAKNRDKNGGRTGDKIRD